MTESECVCVCVHICVCVCACMLMCVCACVSWHVQFQFKTIMPVRLMTESECVCVCVHMCVSWHVQDQCKIFNCCKINGKNVMLCHSLHHLFIITWSRRNKLCWKWIASWKKFSLHKAHSYGSISVPQTSGEIRFLDDEGLVEREVYAAFVISDVGNAHIETIDPSSALVSALTDLGHPHMKTVSGASAMEMMCLHICRTESGSSGNSRDYCCLLGGSGGVVNSLDFCLASLKSLGCFYFLCVLSSQWKAVTVNLWILHCQL